MVTYPSDIGNFVIGYSPVGGVPILPPFPPSGPVTLQQTIKSYLYQQYQGDDDLQAFVDAYNAITQYYVDWCNTINLPVYTNPQVAGAVLDWVGQGLYGIARPTLASGIVTASGVLNSFVCNSIPLNSSVIVTPAAAAPATDDVYKRIITWHFYKGDGKVFNLRWLKRRVARFLNGYDGTDQGTDQTYRISVSFGVSPQVDINILTGHRTITSSSAPNTFAPNTTPLNGVTSTYVAYPPIPMAATFKKAMDSGLLELPFQFTYVVTV